MKKYNSKILLFGEYSVLMGSHALVMPFERFNGFLTTSNNDIGKNEKKLTEMLYALLNHIEKVKPHLQNKINTVKLKNDIHSGLYFKSTIPQNYGLGSSGALCAAVYEQYAEKREINSNDTLIQIRNDLSIIENFFHGESSGSDPLCSYINKPFVLSEKGINITEIKKNKHLEVFLIDSLHTGNTGELVQKFRQKWEDQQFIYTMMNQYIPLNNKCIDSFLNSKITVEDYISKLSTYQLQNFNGSVPASIKPLWEEGLKKELFYMKLCGSGGGGFMLGFTSRFDETLEYFNKELFPLIKVM